MSFTPRLTFPPLSIPRSYFLGHHAAGLAKMKAMLATIDLVVECRDYRTPLTSRNPLFEEHLGARPRLIVYTKKDLGSEGRKAEDMKRERIITSLDSPHPCIFSSHTSRHSISSILSFARQHSSRNASPLFPTRLLIVGMPNVGKSSLLNSLRNISLHKRKAARIGDQPGITRKIGSLVRILPADPATGDAGAYVLDTPGVFIPYVPDAEAMLKLALCANVKDSIIPMTSLADYLLFHLNLRDTGLYRELCGGIEASNDIGVVLAGLARKRGLLKKGGIEDLDGAASMFVQQWRKGEMGRFVLDDVREEVLREKLDGVGAAIGGSVNQARRLEKTARIERIKTRGEQVKKGMV